MDTNAGSGHLPALQRQDDYADLRCANGTDFSLEQNQLWVGSEWILLGLLFYTNPGRTCQ